MTLSTVLFIALICFVVGVLVGHALGESSWAANARDVARREYRGRLYKVIAVDEGDPTPLWEAICDPDTMWSLADRLNQRIKGATLSQRMYLRPMIVHWAEAHLGLRLVLPEPYSYQPDPACCAAGSAEETH